MRILPHRFFSRDPRIVARALLGKVLVRRQEGRMLAGRIVETEAYLGENDAAAHAAAGLTARTEVIFGPPGVAYVYFIYGSHYCLNVSCQPVGKAGCVLVRALEPLAGAEIMAANRNLRFETSDSRFQKVPVGCKSVAGAAGKPKPEILSLKSLRSIASGPGKLTQALGITRSRDNGKDLRSRASDLVLLDDGCRPKRIVTTPRIGITKSAEHPYRYFIAENRFVSGGRMLPPSLAARSSNRKG